MMYMQMLSESDAKDEKKNIKGRDAAKENVEDRMVKNFIKTGNVEGIVKEDVYGRVQAPLEAVNRKPILPSEEEIAGNTRARSAKLRIAQRRADV